MRPVKIQIRLHICAQSSLGTFWIAKYARFLHADIEDWSDCMDVQADLSLCQAHVRKYIFSCWGSFSVPIVLF